MQITVREADTLGSLFSPSTGLSLPLCLSLFALPHPSFSLSLSLPEYFHPLPHTHTHRHTHTHIDSLNQLRRARPAAPKRAKRDISFSAVILGWSAPPSHGERALHYSWSWLHTARHMPVRDTHTPHDNTLRELQILWALPHNTIYLQVTWVHTKSVFCMHPADLKPTHMLIL